jgi:membrane-associated phospholipid phosphatase
MMVLAVAGAVLPIVVNLVINFVLPRFLRITVEQHDTRDFLLSLLQSVALCQILTQFIKNQTGRFRPSFYDMCGWQFDVVWDGVTNLCTDATHEKEGRKSFPSGHSSYSWATMLLLTVSVVLSSKLCASSSLTCLLFQLYLLGRSRLNAINRGESIVRGGKKSFKLFLCFAPTLFASWVAITRSVDNWHHYSDILAGSIIGAVSACVAYFNNYGSVFNKDTAGSTLEELRRRHQVCPPLSLYASC